MFPGLFGSLTLGVLLVPMYYILVPAPFSTDPDGRLENVKDAFIQMGNNWQIIVATIGTSLKVLFSPCSFVNMYGV